MQQAPTIHVVDDDEAFRRSISRLLEADGFVVRTYSNAGTFLLAKIEEGSACILLEAHLRGPSGLDLQIALASRQDPLPIIFLSGSSDIQTAVQAMKAGAADFLMKPVQHATLLDAIWTALARGEQERVARKQRQNWRACYLTLTKREQEVFQLVVAGKLNKEIATELGVALRTIKTHRAEAMKKMHAISLADLVHIADHLEEASPLR